MRIKLFVLLALLVGGASCVPSRKRQRQSLLIRGRAAEIERQRYQEVQREAEQQDARAAGRGIYRQRP